MSPAEGAGRLRDGRTVAEAFAELRTLCAEEGYALELPERSDRANSLAEALDRDSED